MIKYKEWSILSQLKASNKLNAKEVSKHLGVSKYMANRLIFAINNNFVPDHLSLPQHLKEIDPLTVIKYLKSKHRSVREVGYKFKISPEEVIQLADHYRFLKHNVIHDEEQNTITASTHFDSGNITLDSKQFIKSNKFKFGVISDNHLGSHTERLDVLNTLYDIFEKEEISFVFNAGNWIEGESHFNRQDIKIHGLTNQILYAVKEYPHRKGIKTYFVSGDDHEGWYAQKNVINIGNYFQSEREASGKYDLVHLGYVEADIRLTSKKDGWDNETWMRVAHPGGGTAYAISYTSQKIVESYQGGEKPNILILGHFHKFDYCIPRGVHVIQAMCTQDQSIFMRKKKIEGVLGGVIVEGNIDDYGVLTSLTVTAKTFFDKKFYIGKDKYQKYIILEK